MKLATPADLPDGGTPAQRPDLAFRKVLTVPQDAILKKESRLKAEREKKRAAKKLKHADKGSNIPPTGH